MQIITWNTGAHYTEHGQRIAAAVLPNGDVAFIDADRGIDGVLTDLMLEVPDIVDLKAIVMTHYLHGWYKHFPRHTEDYYAILEQLTQAALNHQGGYK